MSSSRLPGKIMADIEGYPMLFHIVERTRRISGLDDLVIATTTQKSDDLVEQWAQTNGVNVFRGSEDDVLKRYYDAALENGGVIIVRICADSPLFDPGLVGKMIDSIIKNNGDYVKLKKDEPSANSGVNVFSFRALDKANTNASERFQREHVIPYFLENSKEFDYVYLKQPKEFARNDLRLTVDTVSDLEMIREIYKHLYKKGGITDLKDVLKFLDKNPCVKKINAHVKSIEKKRPGFKIFVVTAGNREEGYGHVSRMITLAKSLTERFANSVVFLKQTDSFAQMLITSHQFSSNAIDNKNLSYVESNFDCVIFDSHEKRMGNLFSKLGNGVTKINYDDDIAEKFADFSIMPNGSKNKKSFSGFKYLILGKKFPCTSAPRRKYMLICAGTTDSHNTLSLIEGLVHGEVKMPIAVLLSPIYKYPKEVKKLAKIHPEVKIFESEDMSKAFSLAKFAVCYFGVTMYELIASGVVCAVYGLNEDHKKQISKFSSKKIIYDLGSYKDKKLTNKIIDFIQNKKHMEEINLNMKKVVDFDGDIRVAQIIQKRLVGLDNKTRIIFSLGAGAKQIPYFLQFKQMGFKIAACDKNKNAPGKKLVDFFENVSTYDLTAVLDFAKRINKISPIYRIVALTTGLPVVNAAKIGRELAVSSFNENTAQLSVDKQFLRDILIKNKFSRLQYVKTKNLAVAKKFLRKFGKVVIKPNLGGMGASWVQTLDNEKDLERGFKKVRKASLDRYCYLEQFFSGDEFKVSTIWDGKKICFISFEKACFDPEIGIINGHAIGNVSSGRRLIKVGAVEKLFKLLEIKPGPVGFDMIVGDRGFEILDLEFVLSDIHLVIGLCSKYDLYENEARAIVGLSVDENGRFLKSYAVRKFVLPKYDVKMSVKAVSRLLQKTVDKKTSVVFDPRVHDIVNTFSGEYLVHGYMTSQGQNQEDAIRISEKLYPVLLKRYL